MTRTFVMVRFVWILHCLVLWLCCGACLLAGTLVMYVSFTLEPCFLRDLGLWQLERLVPSMCHQTGSAELTTKA